MRVHFPRLADGARAYSIIERDDGVRYQLNEGVAGPDVPHDLVHFIVERDTNDEGGFWGAVAAGAVFGSMEHLDGRRPPHVGARSTTAIRERGSRLMRAELMAGLVEDVERRGVTSADQVRAAAKDALSTLPDTSVDAERVLSAAHNLGQVAKQRSELEVGEELVGTWSPGGRGCGRAFRARRVGGG